MLVRLLNLEMYSYYMYRLKAENQHSVIVIVIFQFGKGVTFSTILHHNMSMYGCTVTWDSALFCTLMRVSTTSSNLYLERYD